MHLSQKDDSMVPDVSKLDSTRAIGLALLLRRLHLLLDGWPPTNGCSKQRYVHKYGKVNVNFLRGNALVPGQ